MKGVQINTDTGNLKYLYLSMSIVFLILFFFYTMCLLKVFANKNGIVKKKISPE